jgi:probable phosphoglycerate mutase
LSAEPATLLLVRHAETEHNVVLRLSGWTDSQLSERGEQQVALLAEHFNKAHGHLARELYSSPLTRARRTAEAIGALIGREPLYLDDLREMYFGDLDGQPYEELKVAYAHVLARDEDPEAHDFMWPNGESRTGFEERTMGVIDQIARSHPGESVGIITHGGIIAVFLAIMHGDSSALWRKWSVPNASLTEVRWDPASHKGELVRHGEHAHLGDLAIHPAVPLVTKEDLES